MKPIKNLTRTHSQIFGKIQETIEELEKCKRSMEHFSEYSKMYDKTLNGQRHNFPPFPIPASMISDIRLTVKSIFTIS
jgi:hypothetical protein